MKHVLPAILYEDDWIAAVDKPAGLLTIPAGDKKRSLTDILNSDLAKSNIAYRLHPCHRLDRETSGVILYAKGKSAQNKMMELFKQRKVKKTYIAFVHGRLQKKSGVMHYPVEGHNALTHYKLLEQKKDFSVFEVIPVTGRKNQIRLHFKRIGHPLVGESRFAFRKDFPLKAKRTLLHSAKVSFTHPLSGRFTEISSRLPSDMERFLSAHP